MAAQPAISLTFHKILAQCDQASPDAWRAFLEYYSPLALHLLRMYLPAEAGDPAAAWRQVLQLLARDNFQRFRSIQQRQSEREFLAALRLLLFQQIHAAPIQPDPPESPAITAPAVQTLLQGLPLLHQEMLFLKLAGYADSSIEKMLRIAPRVAQPAFARLEPDYRPALQAGADRCCWPRQWVSLSLQAAAAKQENCPQPYQFLRVHDGQVSWYDKEPLEKHVAACLHCLELWTALREVGYWRTAAPPLPPAEVQTCLAALPLKAAAGKRSWLRKLFR